MRQNLKPGKMLAIAVITSIFLSLYLGSPLTTVAAQEQPLYGDTLRIGIKSTYEMSKWLPYAGGGAHYKFRYTAGPMWDQLLNFDENWEFTPELATDWETPDGGITWIIHLVENAYWHDGVKFTSADVKFQFDTIANWTYPDTIIPVVLEEGKMVQDKVESITTPDDYTVVFHCYVPTLLEDIIPRAQHICMPKHIFEGTDTINNPAVYHPIGTGPFKFVKHVSGVYIEFERNDNYWREDQPYVDKIIKVLYATPEAAIIALEAGELDYIQDGLYVPSVEVLRLIDEPGYGAGYFTYPNTIRLRPNLHPRNLELVPALADPEVRRALSYAIDRESICEHIFFGTTDPNSQYYAVVQKWVRPPDVEFHAFDLEKAGEMLDDAGWPVLSDGYRFDIGQMVCYPQYIDAGEIVKANWLELGIKLEIRAMEMASIVDQLEYGPDGLETVPGVSFLLHTMETGPAPALIAPEFHSEKMNPYGKNCGMYNNSEFDAIIETAISLIDPSERQEAYWELARLFDKEMPIIVLFDKFRTFAWSDNVNGVPEALLPQAYYTKYEDIWLSTGTLPEPIIPVDDEEDELEYEELESKIESIESTVQNLASLISSLDSKISSLDSKISSLESQLEDIPTEYDAPDMTMTYGAILLAIVALAVSLYVSTKSK